MSGDIFYFAEHFWIVLVVVQAVAEHQSHIFIKILGIFV